MVAHRLQSGIVAVLLSALALSASFVASAQEPIDLLELTRPRSADRAQEKTGSGAGTAEPTDPTFYKQFLVQAERALAQKDGAEAARKVLDLCPPELRGFEWHYLHRKAHADGMLLKGHAKPLRCAIFSPDGKALASGSMDHTIKLWELRTLRLRHMLKGHDDSVLCLAYSADGKTLASGSLDRTIKLWDAPSGKLLYTLAGHPAAVAGLAFHPDGNLLASFSNPGHVRMHALPNGELRLDVDELDQFITTIAFNGDGTLLATGGSDKEVTLRAAPGYREVARLKGHTEEITGLHFLPDGELASAGLDGLRTWHLATGVELRALTGGAQQGTVGLAGTPRGTMLATVNPLKAQVFYEPFQSATDSYDVPVDRKGFVALHPRGHMVAVAGPEGTLRVHDLGEQTSYIKTGEPVWSVQPGGKGGAQALLLAMRSDAAAVSLSSTGSKVTMLEGHEGAVRAICATADGRLVATAGVDGVVRIWSVAGKKPLIQLRGHKGVVRGLAFKGDGKRLASAGDDGTVRIWDAAAGKELQTLRGHKGMVTSVTFLPKSHLLVSAGGDGTIRLWDSASAKLLQAWQAHGDVASHLAVSPDGTRLATTGYDRTLKIWRLDPQAAPRKALHVLPVRTGMAHALAFSPDGKRLATGETLGGGVNLVDVASGRVLFHFPREAGPLNTVGFSADGMTLSSGSYDGSVMLWKARPVD